MLDCIYVLKLRKNDSSEMETQLGKKFPNTKHVFYNVDGKTVNRNEGPINMSFWTVVNQNYVDEIALDITKNHIEMIKTAYLAGHETVLFMEEDARIEDTPPKKTNDINLWLQNSNRWDIFYLGYCNWPMFCSFFVTSSVVKLWSPLNAHSYILSKRGMEKILNYTEYGRKNMDIHVDKMYSKIPNFYKYGAFPMFSFQNKDPALFLKACDKLNINISMRTSSILIQYVSLLLPLVVLVLFVYVLMRMFWR